MKTQPRPILPPRPKPDTPKERAEKDEAIRKYMEGKSNGPTSN